MENRKILSKDLESWIQDYPLIKDMIDLKEVFWTNPDLQSAEKAFKELSVTEMDIKDAQARLERFAPYIRSVFPETEATEGIIESPVKAIPNMKRWMSDHYGVDIVGNVLLKCDSHLAISGSIKARGGIYEVLKHAEDLAMEAGMLTWDDDYTLIDSEAFRTFYSGYSIAVGSTGNLGLSIGIMSAKLGFKVFVHMSADAKQWKKDLLRQKGVTVVEYASDYSKAVEEGRKQSDADPNSYFVDDENSKNLFLGYAVAAYRLKAQFDAQGTVVDADHPLIAYLPCGVGGGPGGVAYGLKMVFGDNAHCFFAEPTHSPCMLLGLMTGAHDRVSVQDFGLDNVTEADGLAVGRASGFVGKTLENLISGDFSIDDDKLFVLLKALKDQEEIFMEPSAFAGLAGIPALFSSGSGKSYLKEEALVGKMDQATHLAWGTGGSMVPQEERDKYYAKGSFLLGN